MGNEEAIEALKARIRQGNLKLNLAWSQLKEMTHNTEEWATQFERWHQANEKLSLLCTELKLKGYEDCLYLENGKKVKKCLEPGESLGCRVCPCGSNKTYWQDELMSL